MGDAITPALAGFTAGMVLVAFLQILSLKKRTAAITRVEGKIDLLLEHAGLEFDPYSNISDEVLDAINSGKKTLAIRLYRDATGTDLVEAKAFIEEVERRRESGPSRDT